MHWCDFCKTNHSSVSCFHPGNPKNQGDYPVTKCPDCGDEKADYDGFGTLHCFKCGFCTHAAITGGVCELCGKTAAPTEKS